MNILILILFIMLLLGVNYLSANKMTSVAFEKGYDVRDVHSLHVFAWCFWLPLVGYLYVIALPDLRLRSQNAEIITQNAEIIKRIDEKSKPEETDQLPNL